MVRKQQAEKDGLKSPAATTRRNTKTTSTKEITFRPYNEDSFVEKAGNMVLCGV